MCDGSLPGCWHRVALGEVLKERQDRAWPGAELLSVTSDRGVIRQTESAKRDTSSADKSKYKAVYPNDVVYNTMRMWQGVSALSPYMGIVSPAYTVCVPTQEVEPRFIAILLKHPKSIAMFHQFSQGLVDDTLNLKYKTFASLSVLIPPLPEQRRIAAILDTVDAAIQQTEALIAKLKQVNAGLLHDLLTLGVDRHGNLRDPITAPEKFTDSPLGLIPKDWTLTTLGRVIHEGGGTLQTGPFGSQLHAHEYVTNGVPVVMPQDIQDEAIAENTVARVPEVKARSLARHRVVSGDILFARRGDLERCVAITDHEAGWLCGTGCLLVRPPKDRLRGEWLAATYRHDRSQRQILARAVGTTMVNLNTALLSGLVIAVPDPVEQGVVAELIRAQAGRLRADESYRDKLKLLKKGLMDDLLTGRVRVTNVEEVMA